MAILSSRVMLALISKYNLEKKGSTLFDLITAHILTSAQSSNFVCFKLQLLYFYLLLYKIMCYWYSFELPSQVEAILMITTTCAFKEN